ncbi:MAG: response regulator transcription factor [Spirochaetales bacterium]|nr:response regulator transcription factor [Spirochaetales bacterium]
MVSDYLSALGYETVCAFDGFEALKRFHEGGVSCLVLDVMLPGIDGIDVLRRVRETSQVPVLLLTAKSREEDKVLGLDTGADDYLVKPFSMKELAARIRALLRRSEHQAERASAPALLSLGAIILDEERHQVTKDGIPLDLTAVQFRILKALLERPGKVFTRLELLNVFQEHVFEGYERTIDVHIKNIRKILEKDPSHPDYLQTVWGVGYKMTDHPPSGKAEK